MLRAAFLHDTEVDFLGGAELSNQAILKVAGQNGIVARYDNLSDFEKTKALIRESDFVIVNSTIRCEYEFLLIDFLITCGKPYIKWEHDYNFCAKRTAMCFVDRKVKNCCDSGRFTMHRKLFAHAKLSVFVSPKHYELHKEIYGAAVQIHLILPAAIDAENIQSLPKKKNTVCFIGNLTQQKGGDKLLDYASQNPHLKVEVFGGNKTGRELPVNVTLKGKRPNAEILQALAETEYFFFQPEWLEPGGRVAAEAFLAGCKTISNASVGFHSFPFYPAYPEIARDAMCNAPHLFWEKVKEAVRASEQKLRWKNVLIFKSFGGLGDFLFAIPAIHKIAAVSEKIFVCAPFALQGLIKKQLPQYEIHPEDFVKTANLSDYDKVIDLSNYPSYRGDPGTYKMSFPSYRRIKQHAFRHYLDGVATLHPEIDNSFERFPYFTSAVTPKEKYFTVHPGAGFEAKYWPAWKYGKLITTLLELFGNLQCKLILGPNDPKPEELFEKLPERVSIPKGNLETVGDVLAGALFHVGNDSGITHLAGAFNTPTVTIHGPTGPGTWMSFAEHKEVIWGKQGVCNIPCNYDVAISCAHRICLNSVTPQRVLKHVLRLLQGTLQEQNNFRFIFNPDVVVEKFPGSFILKLNDQELLVEFSAEAEKKLFEGLLGNKLQQTAFSESFEQLVNVLIENELLFKIPELPTAVSKSVKFKHPADVALKYNLKELIYSNQYMELLHILESNKTLSIQEMKALSLVYRIFGQQKKELPLLKKIVAEGVTDDYYLQRVKQYNDDINSMLVPRKVSSSNFKFNDTIKRIISENRLCFVTASSSEYFSLLVECVSSILSCKNFASCPIYVVDSGLSNRDIAELKELSNRIDVVNVTKVFAAHKIILNEEDRFMTGILFRGFFQELFPDFDFCFFIDADAWIQDETSIYDYLELSIKEGIAVPSHPSNSRVTETSHWLKRNTLTKEQKKAVIGFPAVIACCFCANFKSAQYQDYKDCFIKNIGELGIHWGIDQETLLFIAAKYNLSILPTEYAYEGNPMLKIEQDGSHLLFTKEKKLIKIYHLGGGRKYQERKWAYFTDAYLISSDSKSQLSTSVHFFVPEWGNRNIIADQLKQLFDSVH